MDDTHLSQSEAPRSDAPYLDLYVFVPAFVVAAAFIGFMLYDREVAGEFASFSMATITANWGWLFYIFGFAAFVFALWLAFGRYGNVKLGMASDEPEFSEMSWAAMMFAAGIGVGLVSWSFVEPIYYLSTPPFDLVPQSSAAAEWAHMYALFHWSFVPWALYAVPAVAVAYVLYVERQTDLRLSVACARLLGRHANGPVGSLIDTFVILGLIGGAGTSLGLGVPLVAAFFAELFGLPDNLLTQIGVLGIWTVIFGASVYRGLNKGIRILSDVNIVFAVLIAVFVLIVGPTVFILSLTANSFGLMLNNFVRMSFWLDPIDRGGFPDAWTLFYWAWWIAYAPMMGLFFGRISKGRTIKRLVLGVIVWGSLGCVSFMAICGGYALDLQLSGALPVSEILSEKGIPQTVVEIVKTLPFGNFMVAAFMVLSFIFLATTLDSAAYVLASISTKGLRGSGEPARANRLCWAAVLAMTAVGLLYVEGLRTVQSSTIVMALPLIPVLFVMAFSLYRSLSMDFGAIVKPAVLIFERQDEK
jgi:BCCT family betaine/carnitine transporter